MNNITLANFREYISKKPLIPNTTKVLKTKKTKISKNKFNPKNVCGTPEPAVSKKTPLLTLSTRTNEITSASNTHLISDDISLDNISARLYDDCKIATFYSVSQSPKRCIFHITKFGDILAFPSIM